MCVVLERCRWLSHEVLRVVDGALDRREGSALTCEVSGGQRCVVADKLSNLGDEVKALKETVADAHHVGEVTEAHNPKTDAAHVVGSSLELRNARDVLVGRDDVVEKMHSSAHRLGEFVPEHAVCRSVNKACERLMEPRQQFL